MVSYAKMTEKELEEYRKKQREYDKKREEEWKKEHPKGVDQSNRTPFDTTHHVPYVR